MTSSLALWRDRQGRLSALRIVTLAILLWPAVLAGGTAALYGLGPRPINDLIHRAGFWALMFILASLAITPFRRSGHYAKLIDVRRMIGVAAFAYALSHFGLYILDQGFDLWKVASEIVRRFYLTIGFVALLGLLALAVTSNDLMVRRLGGTRWRRLHQITYMIGLLALVHFFQQTKADVSVPATYAGLFAWLIGYRLVAREFGENTLTPLWLTILAVVVSALTFVGEAIGIGIAFKVPPQAVLTTIFDFSLGIRPGWYVLAAGLLVVVLDLATAWWRRRASPPRRTGQMLRSNA